MEQPSNSQRSKLLCKIYPLSTLSDYKFVVICSRFEEKWLLSKHKKRSTWETQGGHVEPGETPMEAAKRELREETGATAGKYTFLGELDTSPALLDEKIHMYLAEDLTFGDRNLDDDEFLNVKRVSFTSALEMIYDNQIRDSKTAMAVLKYKDLLNLGKLDGKKI